MWSHRFKKHLCYSGSLISELRLRPVSSVVLSCRAETMASKLSHVLKYLEFLSEMKNRIHP